MIGLVLAAYKKHMSDKIITVAIDSPFKVITPMAHPSPLYLESVDLSDKYKPLYTQLYGLGQTGDQIENVDDAIEDFRRGVMYPHIINYLSPIARGPQSQKLSDTESLAEWEKHKLASVACATPVKKLLREYGNWMNRQGKKIPWSNLDE